RRRRPAGRGNVALSTAVYASIACVSASMPLSAVTFGGHDTVSIGSTSATRGGKKLLVMANLSLFSVLVQTDGAETSEPVPAVVGTQISDMIGPGILSSPT